MQQPRLHQQLPLWLSCQGPHGSPAGALRLLGVLYACPPANCTNDTLDFLSFTK